MITVKGDDGVGQENIVALRALASRAKNICGMLINSSCYVRDFLQIFTYVVST